LNPAAPQFELPFGVGGAHGGALGWAAGGVTASPFASPLSFGAPLLPQHAPLYWPAAAPGYAWDGGAHYGGALGAPGGGHLGGGGFGFGGGGGVLRAALPHVPLTSGDAAGAAGADAHGAPRRGAWRRGARRARTPRRHAAAPRGGAGASQQRTRFRRAPVRPTKLTSLPLWLFARFFSRRSL
jgi:hypothetical protein